MVNELSCSIIDFNNFFLILLKIINFRLTLLWPNIDLKWIFIEKINKKIIIEVNGKSENPILKNSYLSQSCG